MALCHIQRGDRSRVRHQVLHAAGAPNSEKTPFAGVLRLGTAAPQGVIQSIGLEDFRIRYRLIIGFGLAQVRQQLAPAVGTGRSLADTVQGGGDSGWW
jgi:hypothetical protein